MPDRVSIDRRLGPAFRGSTEYEQPANKFRQLIGDYLNLSGFAHFHRNWLPLCNGAAGREYSSNETFWQSVLRMDLASGSVVRLKNFYLTEWVPIAPGRYFTTRATTERQKAERFLSDRYEEFLPLGKLGMVLGGIGTSRFTRKRILERDVAIVCATSSGVCHQGIPVILPLDFSAGLLSRVARDGTVNVTLEGCIWALSSKESPIAFDRQMPRFYIFAEKMQEMRHGSADGLSATIVVLSERESAPRGGSRDRPKGKLWTFASFDPREGERGVKRASDWMLEYTRRYARGPSTVVCDFDETRDWFPGQIDFPLQNLIRGIIDQRKLDFYARQCDFNIKTRVFISYRRADFPSIAPIYQALAEQLGHRHVFLDSESIPPGRDFRDELHTRIDQCDTVVALIGPEWSGRKTNGNHRIDEENDWVRRELELALLFGKRILPVVVGGKEFPPAQLPNSLKEIAPLQAISISNLADLLPGVNKLVRAITQIAGSPSAESDGMEGSYGLPTRSPVDIDTVPPEMLVEETDLAGALYLESYRGRNLFRLADGRIYLDGLIAVATLGHARATLDHLASASTDT